MNQVIQKLNIFVTLTGELTHLFGQTVVASLSRPFYFKRMFDQMVQLGVHSLLIAGVIGFTMGLVMTLQFGHGLANFGGTLYVPSIVSVSLMRELAPIMTSLLVAGRIGSGIAAEIGSMNVTQQVDAIRALGTSPIRVLVVPRFMALLITLPFLTLFCALMGLIGGMIISNSEFGIPPGFYEIKVLEFLKFHDVGSAMIKSAIFSVIITLLACHRGLNTKDGTRGVGQSTTWVVVVSSITILLSDFFLSKILLYMFEL